MKYHLACAIMITSLFAFASAHADIGAIGSPVVPSNLPKPSKAPYVINPQAPQSKQESAEERTPILSIDFSQRHVYYDKDLRQALQAAETSQPGSSYDVISQVPTGSSSKNKADRLNEDYNANLNDLIMRMQDSGIQPSRIHFSTQPSNDVTAQQIQIFMIGAEDQQQ